MTVPYLEGAACASIDPELWFPEGPRRVEYREQAKAAKRICRWQCVRELECRELVMAAEAGKSANERHGVAGGLLPQERAALEGERAAQRLALALSG